MMRTVGHMINLHFFYVILREVDDENGRPYDQPIFFYAILIVFDDENGRPYDQPVFFYAIL